MNILLVSQCNKRALTETRRILDQFAERKGDRTWQTSITLQGLKTLRKILRKTAKRNTAVACHWIKSSNRTELLWIVGNISQFNHDGTVPTNISQRDILRSKDENQWHYLEDISILAAIAGLFHDFGKANKLFQKKIDPKTKTKSYEPYRHEWVSLRLFEALTSNQSDIKWLTRLANISSADESFMLDNLFTDKPNQINNPFHKTNSKMTKLAQIIAWLIVTHHRLPRFSNPDEGDPSVERIDEWMTNKKFNGSWNSPQCLNDDWKEQQWRDQWTFPKGTPLLSKTWQAKAQQVAARALKSTTLVKTEWFKNCFSMHIARMLLMLSDHYYSSIEPKIQWQDSRYKAYANTKLNILNQKLDEHNLGVAHNTQKIAKTLPNLRQTLPSITRHKGFKKRSSSEKFRWQDKAYDLACSIRELTIKHGFFGINMASTGCGKTFANGKIMYGLSDEQLGCRFSVALGLRTLTLQTGDALRERLKLDEDDLAILVGSLSVKRLHALNKNLGDHEEPNEEDTKIFGSESAEDFFSEHEYVKYDGSLDDGRLSHWLKNSPKIHQLLSAPILVSTIDHLMPATEGERGGKQIAPMLRLLTSDLVLDEPDDFDLNDLPALSRLINWAGMLGSRVLLSSATLPPALIQALFEAYCAGRQAFQNAIGEVGLPVNIPCAWFDENKVTHSNHNSIKDFNEAHMDFVNKRIKHLQNLASLRKAALLTVKSESTRHDDVVNCLSNSIYQSICQLHHSHAISSSKKHISIGIVRMANIKPMIAVAMNLFSRTPPVNHRFHFCVYHSQFPLATRSYIENKLDLALTRHDPDAIWQMESIRNALKNHPEDHHVFIVLATPVAEVGRDHDYDWGITEPSSMRSLIQLSGRIQRHRQKAPAEPNLIILSKNYRALSGADVAYKQPGFESTAFKLENKDLNKILHPAQYEHISAIPRISESHNLMYATNLVDLEHYHLKDKMFGPKEEYHASLWWRSRQSPAWCYEFQKHTPFRKSEFDELYILYLESEDDIPEFCLIGEQRQQNTTEKLISEQRQAKTTDKDFIREVPIWSEGVQPWFNINYSEIISQIADKENLDVCEASKMFGELRLRANQQWYYSPLLGVFQKET